MKQLISVIVPVYNVEKYLHKCVESILSQTYKNLEVILVDDGSPDNCGQICDEYAKKDLRVSVIHQKNGGLSAARNSGIKAAKGDYLAFVDSDDCISPEMYEKLFHAMEENNADIAICGFEHVFVNDDTRVSFNPQKEILSSRDALSKLCGENSCCYIIACNKLYKRELFNNISYPVGKFNEDEAVIHHIYWNADKIVAISDVLYFYLQRENSITHAVWSMDIIEILYERLTFYIENRLNEFVPTLCDDILANYTHRRIRIKAKTVDDKKKLKEIDKLIFEIYNMYVSDKSFFKFIIYRFPLANMSYKLFGAVKRRILRK